MTDRLAEPAPAVVPPSGLPEAASTPVTVTVETKGGVYTVPCHEGANVLYAGLKAGISLPYECATGTCGTCRCRVMEGDTHLQWAGAPGLAHVKQAKNETLMCQARVMGDCTIRVPGDIGALDAPPDFHRGTLHGLRRLTEDVASFALDLDRPMPFKAGQFVVLEAPGLTGGRAYSMTNHGDGLASLEFVVKRKPDGGFSDWLFDGPPEGAELSVLGPLGRATFDPAEDKNILCIAGGSGIAGMMAIVHHGVRSGHFARHRGNVFFGVRTAADVFFADELSRQVETCPDALSVTIALSDEVPDEALKARYPAIVLAQGFVHEVASEAMRGRYENTIGYVAGPPPMVDGALRMLIMEAQLPGPDIRYDKFS